jgi:hypothetical protein
MPLNVIVGLIGTLTDLQTEFVGDIYTSHVWP